MVRINGENFDVGGTSVAAYLEANGYDFLRVAVEKNGDMLTYEKMFKKKQKQNFKRKGHQHLLMPLCIGRECHSIGTRYLTSFPCRFA